MKLLKVKTKNKTTYCNSNGKLHRENDKPAVIRSDGTKEWYQDNKRHRDNGPAFIGSDGYKAWYQHNKRHRDNDLPAIIYSNGYMAWFRDGSFIRTEDVTKQQAAKD